MTVGLTSYEVRELIELLEETLYAGEPEPEEAVMGRLLLAKLSLIEQEGAGALGMVVAIRLEVVPLSQRLTSYQTPNTLTVRFGKSPDFSAAPYSYSWLDKLK